MLAEVRSPLCYRAVFRLKHRTALEHRGFFMTKDFRERKLTIVRHFATASAWTFTIPPIKGLLEHYVGDGKGWADPFAGKNSPAELTNDINPAMPTVFTMDAIDFCTHVPDEIEGVLFDPPYSYRQVSEHYKAAGIKASRYDTSFNFYNRVMKKLGPKIKPGGYAISFGWNSNGFGKRFGFEKVFIMLVAHGQHHHDTIVTVEQKIANQEEMI